MAGTTGSRDDDVAARRIDTTRFAFDPAGDAPDPCRPVISAQARLLHARCVAAAAAAGTAGLIGRAAATALAEESQALMEELVEAGYWRETDVSYEVVREMT